MALAMLSSNVNCSVAINIHSVKQFLVIFSKLESGVSVNLSHVITAQLLAKKSFDMI